MRRKVVRIASLLFLVLLAFAIVELRWARRWNRTCYPARRPVTAEARAALATAGPRVEDVTFQAADGLTLHGWMVPSTNGCVLVVGHGLGENRTQWTDVAIEIAKHGCGALLFDWRAHGESDGTTATWGDAEQADFSAAIDFASKRPDVSPDRIVGFGFSIGASAVAMESARDPRVRGVILAAVWPSLDEEMDYKEQRFGALSAWPSKAGLRHAGVRLDRVRPIDVVGSIAPRPLLLVTGDADDDTPLDVETRVFAAAGEPKTMWIAKGAGHGEYLAADRVGFLGAITSFLIAHRFVE